MVLGLFFFGGLKNFTSLAIESVKYSISLSNLFFPWTYLEKRLIIVVGKDYNHIIELFQF